MQLRLNRLSPAKMSVCVSVSLCLCVWWDCKHFKNSLQLFGPNITKWIQFIFTRTLITPFCWKFIVLHYSLYLLYPLVHIFFRFHTYFLGSVCHVASSLIVYRSEGAGTSCTVLNSHFRRWRMRKICFDMFKAYWDTQDIWWRGQQSPYADKDP